MILALMHALADLALRSVEARFEWCYPLPSRMIVMSIPNDDNA